MSSTSSGGDKDASSPIHNLHNSESMDGIIAARSKIEKTPRPQTTMEITSKSGTYPLPANVNFVPGGIQYSNAKVVDDENYGVGGGGDCVSTCTMAHLNKWTHINKGAIIRRALEADVTLRKYALKFSESSTENSSSTGSSPGHRLPSLSHLAHSALVNPLTAVPPSSAAEWAEQMILEYMDGRYEKRYMDAEKSELDPSSKKEVRKEIKFQIPSENLSSITTHDPKAAKLLEDAISAAWAQQEISHGHKRTKSNTYTIDDLTSPNEFNDEDAKPPSLSSLLKSLYQLQRGRDLNAANKQSSHHQQQNPLHHGGTGERCGYVFRRGDIAWNCRTCQTDSTCVLCESCFRDSDHKGHEVFFHRTTPGGCCDCGDVEAWAVDGMCWAHRPIEEEKEGGMIPDHDVSNNNADDDKNEKIESIEDDFEAVRAAKKSRLEHIRHVTGTPSPLPDATLEPQPFPPRLAAALGVIIGTIIQSVYTAAEGSAVAADVSQWRLKWANEICNLWNGVGDDEEYYRRASVLKAKLENRGSSSSAAAATIATTTTTVAGSSGGNVPMWTVPKQVLDAHNEHYLEKLPQNYKLFLRLHNDDVHTFDEVIGALKTPVSSSAMLNAGVKVPVGGVGSVGHIGGSGMSGSEMLAIAFSNAASVDPDNNKATKPAQPSNEALNTNSRRLRSNDSDVTQPPERRFRGENSPSLQNNTHQFVVDIDCSDPLNAPLVSSINAAQDLTRRVDADGQVLVREYVTLNGAGVGFARLREPGLLCSVVTTARIEAEERASLLLEWLSGLLSDHPVVRAIVVQALVDVTDGEDVLCSQENQSSGASRGVAVWCKPRMLPCWSGTNEQWWNSNSNDGTSIPAWRKRLDAFHPHMESSYLTREEGRELFIRGMMGRFADQFVSVTGADPNFYAHVPYSLPDSRLCKSPHALWGTLPLPHLLNSEGNDEKYSFMHPILRKLADVSKTSADWTFSQAFGSTSEVKVDTSVALRSPVFVVDTDLRKHQESESLTSSLFPHKMAGLNMVSGVSHVDESGSLCYRYSNSSMGVTTKEHSQRMASCSSFIAPTSPLLLILLLDPYSPKQLRSSLHRLFLSLLTDSRFKSRFAASLGAVAYRPTSTLFCAGIGTEADTLLGFTVQLFTTGSLVKALCNLDATKTLLCREDKIDKTEISCVSTIPIAHSVVRSIHTNILGATKEVTSVVGGAARNTDGCEGKDETPLLVYQFNSEHPLNTRLPAAPDDKFIDSRCIKHKRLPHLLRDLEYIFETPGTAIKLLKSAKSSSNTPFNAGVDAMSDTTPTPSFNSPSTMSNNLATYNIPNAIDFSITWARLLRLGQGIDSQKRRISGGHVEYEEDRWLHAYGLSLNFSGTGDALAESPFSSSSYSAPDQSLSLLTSSTRITNKEAVSSLFAAFFREIKMWLYREGLLEISSSRALDSSALEALQRSTLHVSASQLDASSIERIVEATGAIVSQSCDIACEKGVRNLPEAKLALFEAALLHERTKLSSLFDGSCSHGPVMGDWVKVPHSPLAGDCFSFHLPLHRAMARTILSFCSAIVPTEERSENPNSWWRLPLLDDDDDFASVNTASGGIVFKQDSLSALVRSTHKSSNFRVVWSSGPECSTPEAQLRKSRSRLMSSLLASTKVVHSLCDHPLRCIAASQQIDHHMWAKNGASTAGMALNYGCIPLCRSLRDLDLTMVQMSACGFNVGLGARRVFALLINRFSMDGYLCDPDRKNSFGRVGWVKPPRMQEPEHPEFLAESFFTTVSVLVSDLPPPPPTSLDDNSVLRRNLRRELLHSLAVEPRSHSEAMQAASAAVSRRDETEGKIGASGGASSVRTVFAEVLQSIGQQRNQGSRSAPPTYELKAEASDEYDPSFYHLRKTEHQHAMDNIARLRKQKVGASSTKTVVLPLVTEPPQGHPRFLACRLLIHLPPMFAAVRRYLMYALFNGSWLPPSKPEPNVISNIEVVGDTTMDVSRLSGPKNRAHVRAESTMSTISAVTSNDKPFSPESVASSSKSFLEVLHILTLQVHTLEECSGLHEMLPFLDHEQKAVSLGITIDSYLKQLLYVPKSLVNVWALQCAPDGPLPSDGSGENRGSVLGLLIALYEHRDNGKGANGGQKAGNDDHGGARALSSDGLKWLLRFLDALVDGAGSMKQACEAATYGVPIDPSSTGQLCNDTQTRNKIQRMLANLPDLWPGTTDDLSTDAVSPSGASEKMKEAQKSAQARALARMKKLQSSFAASMSTQLDDEKKLVDDNEENLCIICKCDDADGDNGPMGYLGHVQRSRVAQLASESTLGQAGVSGSDNLSNYYRVVGDKGCQLRSTNSTESAPVALLPLGSIVEVLQSNTSPQLSVLSRRVYVRHVTENQNESEAVQGWASLHSWHGYKILSPLKSLCYTNTRWGPTRPIIRQCGHAAHLRCVDSHCLSLHQRAAANQPYDGRFAANIEDGEFLCPLCKQLSNIVIPEGNCVEAEPVPPTPLTPLHQDSDDTIIQWGSIFRKVPVSYSDKSTVSDKAIHSFGSNLLQAMQLPSKHRREREYWHPALRRWNFEDEDLREFSSSGATPQIRSVLRLMRQLLVSWSAAGHSAAAAEASGRGVREIVFGEATYVITDPWSGYESKSRDSHPMLLELKRTLAATASLLGIVSIEMGKQLGNSAGKARGEALTVIEKLIGDILNGDHWMTKSESTTAEIEWSAATSIISSMACHVSKEDTIAPSREARAVAAAMWTITGSEPPVSHNSSSSMDVDSPEVEVNYGGNSGNASHDAEASSSRNPSQSSQARPVLPPKPLALYRAERNLGVQLVSDWGTLDPFEVESGQSTVPFRPAVASAFLYVPLLGWDLNTFSGAVFSSLLSTSSSAGIRELLQAARVLYVGRLAQVLSTPMGFLVGKRLSEEDCDGLSDDEQVWDDVKRNNESASIKDLLTFCRGSLPSKVEPDFSSMDDACLLQQVSNAILPFGRTLILLLRASTSILRQRQRRGKDKSNGESNVFESMTKMLERGNTMKIDDGFQLMEVIGAPLPSSILKSDWMSLITRWLATLVGFESYHGTRGSGLVFDDKKKAWVAPAGKHSPVKVSSIRNNIQVEPSALAVEVAQLHSQYDEMNDEDPDEGFYDEEGSEDISPNDSDEDDEEMHMELVGSDEESDEADMDVDDAFAPQEIFARSNRRAIDALSSYLLTADTDFDADDDASDANAALSEPDASKISEFDDRMFAHVSRAAILPYQPSILGLSKIGPGPRGERGEHFEYNIASHVMKDLSHLGSVHLPGVPSNCLVKLPLSFVELYSIVNKVKGRDSNSDDADDDNGYETAVCLLTGAVMRSGRRSKGSSRQEGTCTLHARKTGSGIGIFFLVQKCTVLLMHNDKSAYSPSLYVDENGEEDIGLRRGRPLFFSEERYQVLETLWRTHGIPREVSQIRSTSDRVIRDNWY